MNHVKRLGRSSVVSWLAPAAIVAFATGATTMTDVPNVDIPNISTADFQALFPDDAICALGQLLSSPNVDASDDTLYLTCGAWGRLQSAVYQGAVGTAAEGMYAYVYQLDCTGGLVDATKYTLPLTGAVLDTTLFGAPLVYMATIFEDPAVCLSTFPSSPLFTGNLSLFNLSEFGSLGGTTGDGLTTAVQDGDSVVADSGDSMFWSGSLLVFVTDKTPVISSATVELHDDLSGCQCGPILYGSNSIVACVPTPAPPVDPDDGDIIIPPTDNNPPVAVCMDITVTLDAHECHAHVHVEDIDGGSFDPDGDTIDLHITAVNGESTGPGGTHEVELHEPGIYVLTLTVSDENGGISEPCDAVVTVVDVTAPEVSCSLSTTLLWPPNHDLITVGLDVHTHDNCEEHGGVTVAVAVYADEDDETPTGDGKHSPDAKDIASGTLRLRSERRGDSDGRVYLIVATATDASGNSSTTCCTVVVPHDGSKASIASVLAQADAAKATFASTGAPPSDYFVSGDGPIIGPKQ